MNSRVYRDRAELIVTKNCQVALLTPVGVNETYSFPGGGVDEGETIMAAARREALEEAGLEVGDIRQLSFEYVCLEKFNGFKGNLTRYCTAEFIKHDVSHFNSEKDGRPVIWVSKKEATELLINQGGSYGRARSMALLEI